MPEFSEAGLRSLKALALAGVFASVFFGGFDRLVPVLGPCPLMPCANAESETATRTAAAVNMVVNFIVGSQLEKRVACCNLAYS